ncbi:unnamed protein product [Mesocestoides corti]|uniref:FLYWCH-type domain-containing protein n=1 Tax=Mesocestoides corti TaxID=53468 RepID=A0A0R3UPU9_MESCO|nr:unnamed protein product [Mesocestoides corti]
MHDHKHPPPSDYFVGGSTDEVTGLRWCKLKKRGHDISSNTVITLVATTPACTHARTCQWVEEAEVRLLTATSFPDLRALAASATASTV